MGRRSYTDRMSEDSGWTTATTETTQIILQMRMFRQRTIIPDNNDNVNNK